MLLIRAFIAGIVIPSLVIPFVVLAALYSGVEGILISPFIHFVPILWGIWNILYFKVGRDILPGGEMIKLFISGAALGLLLAIVGVFGIHIPTMIHLVGPLSYSPLLVAPIVYGLLWAFGVKFLNTCVGIR